MIPRIRIAHLPTPIEPLPRLSAALGGPRLWVKRDDQTGLAMGGNKTRKLEFVLAEAQAHGAQTLITVGAVQSNHCRQTAALAARFGLRCTLVLFGDVPQTPSGNYLLDRLFGAEIVWAKRETYEEVLQDVFQRAWSEGQRPFLIPLGASTPTGAVAYAYAFKEFIEQGGEADWMVLASSSAGTQAGLVLGARLSGWRGRILGISVDHPADWVKARVAELATQAQIGWANPYVFRLTRSRSMRIILGQDMASWGKGRLKPFIFLRAMRVYCWTRSTPVVPRRA